MGKKTGLWRGLSGLMAALTVLSIFANVILFRYAHIIQARSLPAELLSDKSGAKPRDERARREQPRNANRDQTAHRDTRHGHHKRPRYDHRRLARIHAAKQMSPHGQ